MKDFLLLTETEHDYSKDRQDYIEKLLMDEKMRSIEKKKNRVINKSELNVISLGPSENIKLNITKSSNNDIINRLRCTWIRAGEQYECLVDTGASHAFLKEDQVNKIPKNLIINKRNYKSSMFTAGGNLKNNIKAKIIIICSFQLDNGENITIPIEFLVATHLNGWNMILGESFLGNEDLNASIHNKFISLTRKNKIYNIVLFHSKPHEAAGYVKSGERLELAPYQGKQISIALHSDLKTGTALIEKDIMIKNVKVTPTVIKLENRNILLEIKNISDIPITIFKDYNIGLIYKISEDTEESMTFNNFINILTGKKCSLDDDLNKHDVKLYNSLIDNSNENEETFDINDESFENDMEELIKNNPDIKYKRDATGEFQENLTFLPDPSEKVETWTYENVNIKHLNPNQQSKILTLLEKFSDCFAKSKMDVGKTDLMTCDMKVDKCHPNYKSQKQRYMPRDKLKVAQEAADVLLKSGVIRLSESPELKSNLCLVPRIEAGNIRDSTIAAKINSRKTNQGNTWRVCVDLRNLNACSIGNTSPSLTTLDSILGALRGKMVSNLDFSNGFFHIPLTERSCPLTAFYLGDKIYEFCRLSQGYIYSPTVFIKFMQRIFCKEEFEISKQTLSKEELKIIKNMDSFESIAINFMDDLWIYSPIEMGFEGHLICIKLVFSALKRAKVKLGPKKCVFYTHDFKVLGIAVNSKESTMFIDEKKANAILMWGRPSSLAELNSRIFSLNYWEKFLPKLREIIAPWYLVLRSQKFYWDKHCEDAFNQLKMLILADIRLNIPNEDDQLILATDASKISSSQVLFIRDKDGKLRICGCNSRIFSYQDSRRDANFKESISLATGFKVFGPYLSLSSKPPIILCDAKNLMYISRLKERSILANNLVMYLTDMAKLYEFQIFSIPGPINFLSDLLSRAFSKSRFINVDKYNLSKEAAENLPEIGPLFSIDHSTLIKYLESEMLPIKNDKGNRQKSLPKQLEPLLRLYMDRTPEEKYIDTILLLKQISNKIKNADLNSTITVQGTKDLKLNEDDIKNLLNHDISKGSETKKAMYIKPLFERIIDEYFGEDLDPKYKNRIRDALLNNFLKMRRIESSSSTLYNMYENLKEEIITEINVNILESCSTKCKVKNKPNMVVSEHDVLWDDGCTTKTMPVLNNNIFTNELTPNKIFLNVQHEDKNEMDNVYGYSLNLKLLHSKIEKLDKIDISNKDKIKVYQNGKKLDIYFICTGLYPPKTTPYGFDSGIDLYVQSEIILEPNILTKINTQTRILLNTTTCGIIYPKSRSMGKFDIFRGVIDSNYQGDVIVGVTNITKESIKLSEGTSICQMVITECNVANLIECKHIEYFSDGIARGTQGFGSSGNNIKITEAENIENLENVIDSSTESNFLESISLQNTKIFEYANVYNILEDISEEYSKKTRSLEQEQLHEQELKKTGMDYLRSKYMTLDPKEHQILIKEYLNRQTLKNATLYTDAMKSENFDNECIKNLQLNDEYLSNIYKQCKDDSRDNFKIVNKMLYKNSAGHYRLCIPSILLIGIIKCIHEKLLHCSKRQCISSFKKYFYHPFAALYITKYINSCLTCRCTSMSKMPEKHTKTERTITAKAARELLNMDLIPSLPTSNGYTAILIVVDDYTNYLIAIPLSNIESSTIEKSLNIVFSTIGFPRYVRTDCDRRITKALENLAKKIPFIITSSAPYRHEQNGRSEIGVKMIKNSLKKAIFDPNLNLTKSNWADILTITVKALNNIPVSNSEISREEFFFKSTSRNIFNMLGAEKIFEFVNNDDEIIDKFEKERNLKKLENIKKSKMNIRPETIHTGDIVLFVDNTNPPVGVSTQLSPKLYLELFQVLRKASKAKNLEIISLRTGLIHTVHKTQIRKIKINEFISEWKAENYIKKIVNLARFTKPGQNNWNEPLFHFEKDDKSEPDLDQTNPNITEIRKLMERDIENEEKENNFKEKPPDILSPRSTETEEHNNHGHQERILPLRNRTVHFNR